MIDTTNRQCSTIRGGSQSMNALLQLIRNLGIILLLSALLVLAALAVKPLEGILGGLYAQAYLTNRFGIFALIGGLILFRAAFRSVRRRQ